jgi:UDP-N-acetyl-D-mannosaminuronate dehydrogenase
VVTKTQDALNDRKKAINGSKVLVLGAAYNLTLTTCANLRRWM